MRHASLHIVTKARKSKGEVLKRVITNLLCLTISSVTLSGCAFNITKQLSDRLDSDVLYKSFNIQPKVLAADSKCSAAPTVKIVNVETRVEDYTALENGPASGQVSPKEMMSSVSGYLKEGFRRSQVEVDENSTKVLNVKMRSLKSTAGMWSFGSFFSMELNIPETKFLQVYDANENSGNGLAAAAYAIHVVVRKVIDDPAVQAYVLCKGT